MTTASADRSAGLVYSAPVRFIPDFAIKAQRWTTASRCTPRLLKRIFVVSTAYAFASALAGCANIADYPDDAASCIGIFLTGPEIGDEDSQSFTINELMAHSAAMGMTQDDAETLLYLKGISPSHKLAPGETLCIER